MTPSTSPLHPVRCHRSCPVFGLQERRCGPEAAVKTVLRAEVHAQIFTIQSLQNTCDVIRDGRLSHGTVSSAWLATTGHNAW
jgi:hypothetical protein